MSRRSTKKSARGGGAIKRMQTKRTSKLQKRSARKEAKLVRKDATKTKRINARQNVRDARIDRREKKRMAKQSVKGAKQLTKIYGEIDPETANEINKVQPYVGMMNDRLEDEGVQVNDPTDPIEVATKFAMVEDDIENPVDAEDLADAYSEDEFDPENEDGLSEFEHAEKHFDAKKAMAIGMSSVSAGLGTYLKMVEDKKASGVPLTKAEQDALDAKKTVKKGVKDAVKNDIGDKIMTALPWVLGAIALYILYTTFVAKKSS